jgi:hypothetical protein
MQNTNSQPASNFRVVKGDHSPKGYSMKNFRSIVFISIGLIFLSGCGGEEIPATPLEEIPAATQTQEVTSTPTLAEDSTQVPTTISKREPTKYFFEDFEDGESCFDLETLEFAEAEIINGELIVQVNEIFSLVWFTCSEVFIDNFTLELDIIDESDSAGFRFFGVQIRKNLGEGSSQDHYIVRFGLGDNSPPKSCVAFASESSFENITGIPGSSSCWVDLQNPFESGEWIHVQLTVIGSQIAYSIDGEDVLMVEDSRQLEGSFALLAGTNSAEVARFKIDNIQIAAISD